MGGDSSFDTCECHPNGEKHQLARALPRAKTKKRPPASLIAYISILLFIVFNIAVTVHFELFRNNDDIESIENLVVNMSENFNEPQGLETRICHNFSYSELIEATLSICKSGSHCFLTFYLEGKTVAQFDEKESRTFYDWVSNCDPWKMSRSKCKLVLGKQAPCRRKSIFGHGFWMCFNHNYEFEKLVVAGLPFTVHDSLYLIRTILDEF